MKSCFAGLKIAFLFLVFVVPIAEAQVAWTAPSSVASGTLYTVRGRVTGSSPSAYFTVLYKNNFYLFDTGTESVEADTIAGLPDTTDRFRWEAHGPNETVWDLGQTSVPVLPANRVPTASVSVDGLGYGATVTRPFGGTAYITVRFNAADIDGNLTGIRFNVWNSTNGAFDNGGVFQPASGGSGQYTKTVALNSSGAWYFWSDAQDSAGAIGSSGPWGAGFLINVNESAPPNVAPTIVWVSNPASVYVNQPFSVQARANDANGNLSAVNVWRNDQPYAFHGGGNGWELLTDPNAVVATAPGSVTFKAKAGDSAGAEAIIYHTVIVPNRDPSVSVDILNAAQAVIGLNSSGRAPVPINGQFYIRVNGSDPDNRLGILYSRLNDPTGTAVDHPQAAVSGGSTSAIFGPYTANQVGIWNMWAHAQDADQTGYQWQGGGWSGTDLPDVEVFKLDQAIAFPQPGAQIYDTQLVLNASASSGGGVSYTVISGPATMVSANTIKFTGVGAVTVRATQAGDGTYNPAFTERVITVNPANQTITFAQPAPQTFGTPLTLNAGASSGLAVSYEITAGTASVAAGIVTFSGLGNVTVRATQAGNANYNIATPVDRTFAVGALPTAFSFSNLVHTYDGTVKVAAVTRNPVNATFTADLSKGPNAGPYTVTATANGNYSGTGTATLVINQATQSILNFPVPPAQSLGTPLTLGATATSNLAVGYSVVTGAAMVAGNTVSFTGAGPVTIRASQAGNTNYLAATPIERTFSVSDTAAPVFTGPAGAPELLAIGSAGLRMRWNATDNVGVVRYDISIRNGTGPAQTWTQPVTSAAVSSYTQTFDGLLPATTYTIAVTIFDAAGNSTAKQWPVATCPLEVPPTPGFFVFNIATHSILATWAECEENMSLDYYNIEVETVTMVNGSPVYQRIHSSIVDATPGNGLPVSFSTLAVALNLNEATRYRLGVQAVDSGNHRSEWGRQQFSTLDVSVPTVPTALTYDSVTQTSVRLLWTAATDNSGVVKYEVHQLVSGTTWVAIHLSLSATSQVVSNLTPGTQYTFAVRARDEAINPAGTAAPNYSALSASRQVTTLPPSPVITSPATWTVPQNAFVKPYQITALNSPTSFGLSGALPTGLSVDSILGRISGVPTQTGVRAVSISATNTGGATQLGLSINVVANGLIAGAAVDSGVPSNRFNGRLYIKPTQTLTLRPSGSALVPFTIDMVDHEVVRPDASIARPVQTNPTDFFHSLTYLPDRGEGLYRYRVRVFDTADDFIEATADFTVDATAPTPVTNFRVAPGAALSRSVTLSWSASSDLNGVVNYRIEGAVLGANPIVTTGLSAPLTNLQPGTSYPLTIVALDAAGNVSTSAATTATTLVELTSPNTWSISGGSIEGFALLTAGTASSYSVTSGTLPVGLSLNTATGVIAGSASTAGTYTFTLGAHNAGGVATQTFTITVNAATAPNATRIGFETTEGFTAGNLANQVNWAVPRGAALVNATSPHAGSTAVELTGAATRPEVTRSYSAVAGQSVTFVDVYARPAANTVIENSTVIELEAARIAFQQVGANAVVQGYDKRITGWKASSAIKPTGAGGTTTAWVRLTARLDYVTKAWDLYVDGQVQLFDLGFADPTLAAFNVFKIRGATAGSAFLDDVLVSFNNPLFADADKDGMPDDWEIAHGLNPNLRDRALDADGDGLTNFEEYLLHTDPANPDTDGDGVPDGQEIALGLNPLVPDGFWSVHNIGSQSVPAGADFLIIDREGKVHSVTKSTLMINAQ